MAAAEAHRPRREYWVGTSTVAAIVGQKFVPGMLDRYLGRTGYKSQQIEDEPRDPNAPDNLYEYVPGVDGTRGRFDSRSKRTSIEVSLSLNRIWFVLGAAALAAAGVTAMATQKVKSR